jgi:hypothetical protein
MSFYSVTTVYPDHISTVEFPDISSAIREYNYRTAIVTELRDPSVTVRVLRISTDRILDVTPEVDRWDS